MTPEEQQKILARLHRLVNMTRERGCADGEADAAALKLGQMVQKYHLVVSFPASQQERSQRASSSSRRGQNNNADPNVWTSPFQVLVWHRTEKAVLVYYLDKGVYTDSTRHLWIPISQLRGSSVLWKKGDSGYIHATLWWSEQRKEEWQAWT